VPRRLVRDVRVRVDHVALDERSVRQAARELIDDGAQTFAVVLLWSFRNSVHEERVGAIIRELAPDAFVSLSCQVSPIIGEYERTATTALNSYLAPKVAHYLDRIESLPRARGLRGKFNVLNSASSFLRARWRATSKLVPPISVLMMLAWPISCANCGEPITKAVLEIGASEQPPPLTPDEPSA
jgi:N-methylhydantoinase A/oxoprolinase/acetone carboxylase beta subunit